MPFGAGPRVCVGEVLALARLFQLVASTAQAFNIELGPHEVSCDPRGFVNQQILEPVDFEVCMTAREDHPYWQ